VAGVLVFASIVLITIYFREPSGGSLHGIQSGGAAVLRPFEVGAERVASPFRDAYGWFAGLVHAKSENARLRRDLDRLSQQVIANQTAARENADLKRQLHYVGTAPFPTGYDYVTTPVIGRPASEFQQQVDIAAGLTKGIRKNDVVVNADGLVGLVTQVAHDTAQVTLLTDPNLKVPALDLTTQATGVVAHGQGPGTLILDRVLKSQTVRAGEWMVTAGWQSHGLASLYPKGIAIGVVTGASLSDLSLYWEVQLRPRVDFGSLQNVIVLVPKSRTR
jgi:rod shape-determining protein MreC